MAMNRKNETSEERSAGCFRLALWKRAALAVIAVALAIGSTGCALDDLLGHFAGDIPFEQDAPDPSEMGAVDNFFTVPDDDRSADDFRPLNP